MLDLLVIGAGGAGVAAARAARARGLSVRVLEAQSRIGGRAATDVSLGAPVDLFAGVSMIALFAAATRTPVASVIMGMELLGWQIGIPLTFCTLIALKLAGSHSIYPQPKDL